VNFLPELLRIVAHVFFAGLWQGAILIAVVAIALRLCSRVGPQLRFTVWGMAFVVLLATPLLNLAIHSSSSFAVRAARVQLNAIWEYAIALLWIVLMAARAVRFAVHLTRVRGTWKRATLIAADDNIRELLQSSGRCVELCSSAEIDSPSIIGFWSPRLLIPEWLLAKLTPGDMRQIVLHELEHLRRRDDWLNFIQKAGLVLFPLHPWLLWVDRKLSAERELACDASVIASTTQPLEYARCLTRLAEYRSKHRQLALSLAAWSRESELGRRVLSLLEPTGAWPSRHAKFATALLVLALAVGGAGMARVPHLVTFADSSPSQPGASVAVPNSRSVVPVVYRETPPSRATLLKTVMRDAPSTKSSATRGLGLPLHKAHAIKPKRQQPRIILTAASISAQKITTPESGRLVPAAYVLPDEFSSSFAAVPFADGWLIVQL
jgi:beta-lactamase regulating signal transducer with metallopeptidase domain